MFFRSAVPVLLVVLLGATASSRLASESSDQPFYSLAFSTYLGGSGWEHARDIAVDPDGNIVIAGGVASEDFPTTSGALQRKRGTGGADLGSGGACDIFVAKFKPDGKLMWSTYLGGPNYDRAYGLEIDSKGFIYLAGRAGPGFPVTSGVFQPEFQGPAKSGAYGAQNCFAAKLTPDGSKLVWASYAGVASRCRDMAIDDQGDVYLSAGYDGPPHEPPAAWYANAFQKTRRGGPEMGIMKVSSDGRKVYWATWLGGTGNDSPAASIRVDRQHNVYLAGFTLSDDAPTTPGAFSARRKGARDYYVAKLDPTGSKLIYGTYIGSSKDDTISTHNLAVDAAGNAYVTMLTGSDFPATEGAFRNSYGGGATDWGVVKLSPTGKLLHASFLGGDGTENPDGVYVDASGAVYISGESSSRDFPTTPDAFQRTNHGSNDAVIAVLSADFSRLLYGTYAGGAAYDNGRSSFLDGRGNFYMTGATNSTDWPVKNAHQAKYAGGSGDWGNGDVILMKFVRGASAGREASSVNSPPRVRAR